MKQGVSWHSICARLSTGLVPSERAVSAEGVTPFHALTISESLKQSTTPAMVAFLDLPVTTARVKLCFSMALNSKIAPKKRHFFNSSLLLW